MIILNGQQKVSGPIDKGFKWYVNGALNDGTTPHVPYLLQFYQKPEEQRQPNCKHNYHLIRSPAHRDRHGSPRGGGLRPRDKLVPGQTR